MPIVTDTEFFRKSKARIEKLWNELHVSNDERDEFRHLYFRLPTKENTEMITSEVCFLQYYMFTILDSKINRTS